MIAAGRAPDREGRTTAAGADAATARRDLVDDLWRFFSSTRLAMLLILVLAAASVGGTLVMQAPTEIQQNPDALRTWIERTRPKYGSFTDLFQAIGLFWIFQSLWFRALVAVLAINTAVCTANRLPRIWHQVFRAPIRPRDELFERAQAAEAVVMPGATADTAAALLCRALRSVRYRAVLMDGQDGVYVVADRFRLARFGTVLTHGAILLVLLGSVASAPLGFFEESGFAVPIGSTRPIGHGTNLAVRADDFADEYHPDGRPKDYRSELVLFEHGREVARQTVRVNEPLIYNGVRLHQSYFGPAALVAVSDAAGRQLHRDATALIWRSSDGQRPVGYFPVPGRDLHVYLVGSAGEGDPVVRPGEVLVEAYEGMVRTPTYRTTLTQRQPSTIAGLQFLFERELPFTGLRVVYDPGEIVIWIACILLVAGVTITFALPPRQLWARIRPGAAGIEVIAVGAGRAASEDVSRAIERLRSTAATAGQPALAVDRAPLAAAPVESVAVPSDIAPAPSADRARGRRAKRKQHARKQARTVIERGQERGQPAGDGLERGQPMGDGLAAAAARGG